VYGLRATGQTLIFDGFRRVYFEGRDEGPDEDEEARLPELTAEQLLRMLEVLPEQHFTQPPPRFSEATLVKTLEELGIGRPSTYASIISTIQDRGYVRLEDKRFYPEDVGEVVTDLLVEFFPDVVDTAFTAKMEEELDDIAEGKLAWVQVLDEFYGPFERSIEKSDTEIQRFEEELDELCPRCPEEGREPGHLVVKLGKYGKFIGCNKYPECRYIRNIDGSERPEPELLDERCPECGRQLQRRSGRYGPFIGCSGYPDCKYIKREPPKSTGVTCPQCKQGELVEKRTRFGMFYGCSRYPECDLAVNNPPIPDHPCPECGSLLLQRPKKGPRCWNCGAETDENFVVTKSGDPEREAAARAAKAAARAERAAARAAKAKPKAKSTAKKKPAKRTTAKKRTVTKKEPEPAAAAPASAERS